MESGDLTPPPTMTIQQSLAPPDGTTKYVDSIVVGATPAVHHVFFTWRAALRAEYSVFHAHWPELMIRGHTRLRRFGRRRAMTVLIWRLRSRNVPIVRTLHNVAPHEPGNRSERRTLTKFDRATTLFIRLNPTTPLPARAPAVMIPHGHYRQPFARYDVPPSEPGRLLYFGIIRPYKQVDRLVEAFRGMADPDLMLRVVGSPSPSLRDSIREACESDPRISSVLRFVADAELVEEVGKAELVVLPYREMHNSGSVLLALSLDRPVLVPHSAANEALSAEVGPGWIHSYHGAVTADRLTAALAAVRAERPAVRPVLHDRDWDRLGRLHESAYRRAIGVLRGSS